MLDKHHVLFFVDSSELLNQPQFACLLLLD